MENEVAGGPPSETPSSGSDTLSVVPAKSQTDHMDELKAFNSIVSALHSVSDEARPRLIRSVFTFLGYSDISPTDQARPNAPSSPAQSGGAVPSRTVEGFSADRTLSAKEFLLQKKPVTDIERIACLAYYLTHYRETPHFKTLDLSTLNTEAAQIKFANAAGAVENATAAGLLVAAGKGAKQLSAIGELYVQALPDRDAAKAAVAHVRPRRKNRRASNGSGAQDGADE